MPQCVSEMVQVSNLYLQRGAAKILNKALLKFGRKPKRSFSFRHVLLFWEVEWVYSWLQQMS